MDRVLVMVIEVLTKVSTAIIAFISDDTMKESVSAGYLVEV